MSPPQAIARRRVTLLAMPLVMFACVDSMRAGFSDPIRVSAPGKTAGTFHLGLDFFENVTIAYEEGSTLVAETRATGIVDRAPLGQGTTPSIASSYQGTFLAFSARDGDSGQARIWLASRAGPRWGDPVPFSLPAGENTHPCLALDGGSVPAVVWERSTDGASGRILYRRQGAQEADLGRGREPWLTIDDAGRSHIFFLRDDDVYYAREAGIRRGFFDQPVNVTSSPFVQESAPRAVCFEGKTVVVCFEREGIIYLADDSAGLFPSLRPLEAMGASHPSLCLSPGGSVAVAFERDGNIYVSVGTPFAMGPPSAVRDTPEAETDPVVAMDSFANVFVGFHKDNAVYVSNDAGLPQAVFEAAPLKGEAPLTVRFNDRSTGAITGWEWDFGDGAVSHDPSPTHTYESSGDFVVRLQVSGPGGRSPLSHRSFILVLDPRNEVSMAPVRVFPGQEEVYIPVLATHDVPTQGFTIAATYDPAMLKVKDIVYEETNLSGIKPELFAVAISDDPEDPYFTAGILFDIAAPFDGREIPPGNRQRIANVIVDVSPYAKPGTTTRVQLKNQVGRPPLNNIFTVDGFTLLPVLGEGGEVFIEKLRFPPPRFFLRGDADSSGIANITDAILILSYLFAGGAELACADAADITDDGTIDVSDAVYLLGFLFKAGNYPPPPYPDPGLDPTPDELDTCNLR